MKLRPIAILTSTISIAILAGCSTYKPLDSGTSVNIEKVETIQARITRAELYKNDQGEIILLGELQHPAYLRAPIPGHLDIELAGLNGKVMKETQWTYRQRYARSRTSHFSITIPVKINILSAIRVKHHYIGPHETDLKSASPWRNVKLDK